jgi:hypothetical protein
MSIKLRPFSKITTAIIAIALIGCAEGAASYESSRRSTSGITWLEHGENRSVCRDDETNLGYEDRLYSKIPLLLQLSEKPLECSRLLKAVDSSPSIVGYQPAEKAIGPPIYKVMVKPQAIELAQAGQWMTFTPRRSRVCPDTQKI